MTTRIIIASLSLVALLLSGCATQDERIRAAHGMLSTTPAGGGFDWGAALSAAGRSLEESRRAQQLERLIRALERHNHEH